ncbi:hypothetical protein V493_05519 [Pseudogymnoascus sp. VKM F-4281 (FW-2241)]|nr:hypothetical protein V493_05519 [Pseudogymnoascus sp. VKM F-4281 (FW-2241)]
MSKSWLSEATNIQLPSVAESTKQYISQWVHNKRFLRLVAASFTFIVIGLLYYNTLTGTVPALVPSTSLISPSTPKSPVSSGPKYAFATLLSPNYLEDVDQTDIESDEYFLSTRVLNYQLRTSNHTRYHDKNVPFLVMCPPNVAQNKRDILAAEGATIVPVPHIMADWINVPLPTWVEMLDKLLLWSYTDFDSILYLDADVYLVESLNGIFDDEAAQPHDVSVAKTHENDVGKLPKQYAIAGVLDGGSGSREHPFSEHYMNAGFFLMRPDQMLYDHLMAFVERPESFSVSMMEQNLINDVFRHDGPMPWKKMDPKWDTSCPEPDDVKKGYKTIHSKLWKVTASPCDIDPVIGRMWYKTLGHMESFYAQIPLR